MRVGGTPLVELVFLPFGVVPPAGMLWFESPLSPSEGAVLLVGISFLVVSGISLDVRSGIVVLLVVASSRSILWPSLFVVGWQQTRGILGLAGGVLVPWQRIACWFAFPQSVLPSLCKTGCLPFG